MSWRALLSTIAVIAIFLITLSIPNVSCYGVMSIDLGSEWMKVGLVAPSVQMDLVLNAQSQRKTPMAIAISNNERSIGDPAIDVAIKFPDRTFTHFLDLVGKTIDDESVKIYMKRFPHIHISSHEPNSSSILLKHPQGDSFTPLELVAMMIQHAHDQVMQRLSTNDNVQDVVLTVPPYFNDKERSVIIQAAEVVGLNVLRLTRSNSAFALSYGIFRHKDYEPEDSENKTSILFFDQGATHTSATIADYYLVEQLDPITRDKKNETLPTVSIRAQVYDRFLGGLDMQLRLRDHIVKSFSQSTKIPEDKVYKRGRSASKVFKEAGRVKRVLSANNDFLIRIENVIDDKDLRLPITRTEFEAMNEDLLVDRTISILDRLFEDSGTNKMENFESVIIVGGNTRTPRIQQVLMDYFKLSSLGKSVNADEGAALAALYQAASLGRGFRVKKFVLEEFGEEKLRYDATKVVQTTTVAPEIIQPSTDTPLPDSNVSSQELGESSSENLVESQHTASTTEAPNTVPDPNVVYTKTQLELIRKKLSVMRQEDFSRLQRLSLRNSLESLLSEGRSLDVKGENLESMLVETQLWLDEGSIEERDNMTILSARYMEIYNLIHPPTTTTTTTSTTTTTTTTSPPPAPDLAPDSNASRVEL